MSATVDEKIDLGTIAFSPIVPFLKTTDLRAGQITLPEFGDVSPWTFAHARLSGLEPGSGAWWNAQDEISIKCLSGYFAAGLDRFVLRAKKDFCIPCDGIRHFPTEQELRERGRRHYKVKAGEHPLRLTDSPRYYDGPRPLRFRGATNTLIAGNVEWWNRWRLVELPGAFEIIPELPGSQR